MSATKAGFGDRLKSGRALHVHARIHCDLVIRREIIEWRTHTTGSVQPLHSEGDHAPPILSFNSFGKHRIRR